MKITKYFLSLAAAFGMIAGCQKPELVQLVAPEDAVAPVLEAVEDVVFTEANIATDSSCDFNWSPLDYGAKVEIDYTLEAYVDGGEPVELAAMLKKPSCEIPYETLNGVLNYKLGLETGVATDVFFRVTGKFNDYEPVSSDVVKAKFTVVDPIAPVLKPYEGHKIDINVDNISTDKALFSWDVAKYGKNTPIDYSIAVGLPGDEKKVTVASAVSKDKTSAEVNYKDINGVVLYDLEVPANVEMEVAFYVAAKIGDFVTIYSEKPVLVPVKVTEAKKEYKKIYMPGSYQEWKPDQAATKFQVLYEFAGDGIFEGIADFGKSNDEDRQWKFTPEPNWDFDWGIPKGKTVAAEAAEVTLINNNGGDRDNINVYTAKRYYHFTMDTNTGLLKHNYSFDQVGVVGAFTGWADGQDKVMEYNAAERRFWVDIEGLEGQFKFRLDGAWAKCWGANELGVTVSNADGNLEAEAGNYRVYLYISNSAELSYELNRAMYGQEEPTTGDSGTTEPDQPDQPVPPTMVGWGIVGSITNWGNLTEDNTYIPDVALTNDGTWYVAKDVEIPAGAEIKFRKDGSWDTQWGLGADSFAANTEMALSSDGGSGNITPAAGSYDIYLNPETGKAWFINDGSYPGGEVAPEMSEWGLIGSLAACNNWGANIPLYVSGDYAVAKGVAFAAGDQFKFRKGETWGTEVVYEGTVMPDAEYACKAGSGNSTIAEAGTYDVYLALTLDKFYVMTPGKTPADAGEAVVTYIDASAVVVGFSGKFAGVEKWTDPADDRLATFVSKNVTDAATYSGTYTYEVASLAIAENDAFKVRINGKWIGVGEAAVEGLTVTGTGDFIAGEAGTYKVVITFAWDGLTHSDVKVVFSK